MCIKELLQNIASSITGLKSGMDAIQTVVEKLGTRMAETETRLASLENKEQSWGAAMDAATKTVAQLQEKITYLEDAGHRNNVRIDGIAKGTEGRDKFVQTFLEEVMHIKRPDFEVERAHRTGQRGNRDRHVLVHFLRFGAREAVLRVTREKERVE